MPIHYVPIIFSQIYMNLDETRPMVCPDEIYVYLRFSIRLVSSVESG